MGRGIGKAQHRILAELEATESGWLTVKELASRLGLANNQVRRAVYALRDRGRVGLTTKSMGWAGIGEYGVLVRRSDGYWDGSQQVAFGAEMPTAEVRGKAEYVHRGMPLPPSLVVWTVETMAEAE